MEPVEVAREILKTLYDAPNTKETARRELFIGHIGSLFPEYAWQIQTYALGAETAVKITNAIKSKASSGRIDTRKGTLLIEYKKNLLDINQQNEAEDELRKYVAALTNKEGLRSVAKCIATDIARWREYVPKVSPDSILGSIKPEDVTLKLRTDKAFLPGKSRSFISHVRRLVFEDVPLVATSVTLLRLFGLDTITYRDFRKALDDAWKISRNSSESTLGLQLWSEYLENCFDKETVPNEETYLDHVYLVIFARLVAASALASPSEQSHDDFAMHALDGSFFAAGEHRVERFVEEDFFRWVKGEPAITVLKPALDNIHLALQRLDFREARKQDLLTELYQQIMPPDHKAEYGEVFTPTWLASKIVSHIPQCGQLGKHVLDPACGTGSFLRAVIEKKLNLFNAETPPQVVLKAVLSDIAGLDINPVSVIIAKTTVMLALAEWLKDSDEPIEIPIYLCDSLFLPDGFVEERKDELVIVNLDKSNIEFPARIFQSGSTHFDSIVQLSDLLATSLVKGTLNWDVARERIERHTNDLRKLLKLTKTEAFALTSAIDNLVRELCTRIEKRRNNVWAFVLKNTYRPSILKARFDVVISNPPWLAMSAFPAARYKAQLENLTQAYGLTPSGQSRHHLEISTVFALHCVAHYLREGGCFGFILPGRILRGDQHDPLRRSGFRDSVPMKVDEVWDLENVNPLFGRPACVIFGKNDSDSAGFPEKLLCIEFRGDPFDA